MLCSKCGNQASDGDKFCTRCGYRLSRLASKDFKVTLLGAGIILYGILLGGIILGRVTDGLDMLLYGLLILMGLALALLYRAVVNHLIVSFKRWW